MEKRIPFKTVKSRSGNIYLCPVGELANPESAPEELLQQHCIDDSLRPTDR